MFGVLLDYLSLVTTTQEPTAQNLARAVSSVLHTHLRNVVAEDMLHKDVDLMTVDMFNLASEAGLLVFDHARNSGDSRSGSTGECQRAPTALLCCSADMVIAWMPASLDCCGSWLWWH